MAMERDNKFDDFGLGEKPTTNGYRTLNKDGSFNIKKINIPFFERQNFFHTLVTMKWTHFIGVILLAYLIINLLFASIYYSLGVENLTGAVGDSAFDKFMKGYFFSAQTITTLGYGRVAPIGLLTNIVAAIESMLGLLSFALATGLLYGRFSKPTTSIKYSSKAIIGPYENINGLMFRVVNPKKNQLVEVEVTVSISVKRKNSELRDFYNLELERSKVMFFPAMWTIVHPINMQSPLHGIEQRDLLEKDAEIIIMLKAFDESSSLPLYSRSSYKCDEVYYGEKFVYPAHREEGKLIVDTAKINETTKAQLNS